ncbi:single-stranded nucleic acid binding R3H [Mucor lusitanicus]|uniref:Single-stranded nucleic acid binding R3H n=1 Tax=Mucor circinelloides f. lusitanicus TaxID=29924 RepID=A0A8H4F1B4_MUCCL|nr:single-stranded nucleic acid binding R3H [Mucor lusitanicus]
MNPNNNTNDAPLNYYQQQQQQQQLYQPYQQQHHAPSQIYQPQATMQQFSDPVVPTEPDEFIVDLLRKPQERLFLLKLELELEAFIKDEQKLRLDLPGMNSYQRLMVHRLAPYYKLNHYHDAMRKAVYVCKTFTTALPSVRLPDIQLDKSESNDDNDDNSSNSTSNAAASNDPPPQFKIMRRSAGSSSPSSRTSTNDDQSKTDRKNMTYEERKTAYEEARARIFQNMEK